MVHEVERELSEEGQLERLISDARDEWRRNNPGKKLWGHTVVQKPADQLGKARPPARSFPQKFYQIL